ncbi:DUF3866 family protein [Paenibacillus puerhi]|uniref:DUF3866 family protein n=1 Tax=Paenibacillus puerhi TaxID=2692622 RepID=UPI00135BF31F|nr:DUF3866 family protein [Paenibacillus puerhi]
MGIHWDWGIVLEAGEIQGSLQRVLVQLMDAAYALGPAYAMHDLTCFPQLAPKDYVLLNTTAVRLRLGTGGLHFVQAVLPGGRPLEQVSAGHEALNTKPAENPAPSPAESVRKYHDASPHDSGHIMKLRYTAAQRAVLAVEEPSSPHHGTMLEAASLAGTPVLIGELHSMLPAAAAWLRHLQQHGNKPEQAPVRLVYVMSDGGALPLDISSHAARLRELGWLEGTVTYGHAYGGDLEAVNKYTALLAARHVLGAGMIIAAMGPGIVGTGTPYGFSGMETAELINAVHALGGVPVVLPRVGFADARTRHRGLSAHTLTALGPAALARAVLPLPLLADEAQRHMLRGQAEQAALAQRHEVRWLPPPSAGEIGQALAAYGRPITTMNRGLAEEPAFFQAVCTAAGYAFDNYLALRARPSEE